MAKRREQRAAQNAKMSAMGLHLPSAEEVANRKLRVMAERRVKAVLVLQCCVRGNSARQTFQVRNSWRRTCIISIEEHWELSSLFTVTVVFL